MTAQDVTTGYRTRLIAQRVAVAQAVVAGLQTLDLDLAPDRLRGDMLRWATAAALLTGQGQTLAARLSSSYLQAWLSASQVRTPLPALEVQARVGLVPDDVPGVDLEDALRRSAFSVLWRARSVPREDAVTYGTYAANRVAWTAVQDAATDVLAQGIEAHPEIVGWRRIASPDACDRCVLAAQRKYKQTEPLRRRHPSCRCTQEAVLSAPP